MTKNHSIIHKGAQVYTVGLIGLLIVDIIIYVGLLSTQTVDIFEVKPSEGKEIVFGFERGLSWLADGLAKNV